MRLLDKQAGRLDLQCLGMPAATLSRFEHILARPHGIFLVTGPTGSGKTTSLYAALSHLNAPTRNILTVEDPVEYHLPGIGQTPVNSKANMTFARGLRAILRQDPDVVMVGEIRDHETADIAVQASLTGHLVLSTLHTNSAVGAVTRLVDMGVDAYLLASSLVGVLAQRLLSAASDVYKRQPVSRRPAAMPAPGARSTGWRHLVPAAGLPPLPAGLSRAHRDLRTGRHHPGTGRTDPSRGQRAGPYTVSYTHLTLPTKA